jgi:hypothetical protein
MRQQEAAEWKSIPPPACGGTPPGTFLKIKYFTKIDFL